MPQRDKPDVLNGDIPWVRIEDFSGQYISGSKTGQGVTADQVSKMNLRVFPQGTVLCSCSCTMGAAAICAEPLVSNQTFIGLVPREELDSRYLYYLMRGLKEELQVSADGAIQQYLSRDDFKALRVSIPSLLEQRRVADFLDLEDARLEKLSSAHRALRDRILERREAQIHALVTGAAHEERVQSQIPWVDALPSDWQSVKLSYVARMGSGHTPSRSHPEWWVDCTIPWITTGEVAGLRDDRREDITETRELISSLGLANSSAELRPPGTVVLCRTAASAGYSGVMATSMTTSQDFATWTCGPLLDPYYLLWCLRTMRRDLLGRLAFGSTHKTIYFPDLQALRIPLPLLSEQQEIVKQIRAHNRRMDELVDVIDRQQELLGERRQALIIAAVTGQVDVSTARVLDV